MKLQDDICGRLREEILACQLPPGIELREQALAARLGVSKSPVREALIRLSQEQLVSVRPRQGYRVTSVSMAEAEQLLELRRVLELACVRAATTRATGAQRQALREAADFVDEPSRFIAYNRRFHTVLASCCGNHRLTEMAAGTIAQTDRLVHISLDTLQGRDPARLVAEHHELAEAVVAGDRRGAVRLMRQHLEAAEHRILEALRRLPER